MKVKSVFRKLGEDSESGILHYGTKFILLGNNNDQEDEDDTVENLEVQLETYISTGEELYFSMPNKQSELKDPREWVKDLDIESTEDIAVPKMLVDQVIGQKQGVEIVRKAAEQKRHVMLIGDPGTGKSTVSYTHLTLPTNA